LGYRKDAAGVNKLTAEQVSLVESGEASIVYSRKSGLYVRIYKIIWEFKRYQNTSNPSGHSAMQRIEYWKTSAGIIKDHWLTGVGTGDMNVAFHQQYKKMDSPLYDKFRWRSHNQFLSMLVGFGIIGLAWFLFSLLYPPLKLKRMNDYFYLTFFIVIMLSMITEDTIESQTGVTIFAFLSSLFLFAKKEKDTI